jgi:spermidine synthase
MPGSEVRADLWINEYVTPWDIYSHGVVRILAHKRTAFQDMYVVETGAYGKALVLDGKWQSSTVDEFLYHEPLVHPAMVMHAAPRRVLILGGGEGATVREVLRWKSVEKVVMVDIDGDVVTACRKHLPEMHQGAFEHPAVEVVVDDALVYLDRTKERWDVVISDLSDPIEEGPSFKLFTKEYFEQIRSVLDPQGYLVIQAGPVSPAELTIHVRLIKTLQAVFPHTCSYISFIPTYASPWGFAVGSARPINLRPEPAEVDRLLSERTTGGFRMFDGTTLLGLLQVPRHLRTAIAAETRVYTLKEPPKFFGSGSVATPAGG